MGLLIAQTEVRSYNRTKDFGTFLFALSIMHLGALQIFKRVQTVQFPIEMPKLPHKIPIYKLPTLINSIVSDPI